MFTYILGSSREKNKEYRKLFRKIEEFDSVKKTTDRYSVNITKDSFLHFFLNYIEIHYFQFNSELPCIEYFQFTRNKIIIRTIEENVTKEYVEKILNLSVEAVKEYLEQKEKEKTPIYL